MTLAPLRDLVRLLLPAQCVGCGNVLVGSEHQLCAKCLLNLPLTRYAAYSGNSVEQQLRRWVNVDAAMALLYFGHHELGQRIVHDIKYHGNSTLGHLMGRQMGIALQESGRFGDVDLLVPVPLHWRRRLQRGYNQSLLLCEGIAQVFRTPIDGRALRRTRFTDSQTHLGSAARYANVLDAFCAPHPQSLQGRHILLVDDVMTTGATLAACSRVLLDIEGVRVSVAALSVAD